MSRLRSRRSASRRSSSGRRLSHPSPIGHRRPEPLEPRWLLASDPLADLNLPSNRAATALIADAAGNTAQVTGATLLAHALQVESHSLVLSDSTKLGVFIDTAGADSLSNYSATINWGDNSTSTGTVTNHALVPGGPLLGGYFAVSGGHTYTATGDYTFTLAISDTDGSTATVTGSVNVLQASLQAKALPVESRGLTLTGTALADFIDTGGADPASDYTATINWGDSSSSSGTIKEFLAGAIGANPIVGPFYGVAGSHTYAAAGDYSFSVTISDTLDNLQTTVTGTVNILQATLDAKALPVESTGLTLTGTALADFIDTGGADPASDYTATINWGDNSSSSGTIQMFVADPPGIGLFVGPVFQVVGSHIYTAAGDYTFTVTISDTLDDIQTTVTGKVGIAQATLDAKALPVESAGLTLTGTALADFVDTGGPDATSDYTASINWGDSTSSSGTIQELMAGLSANHPIVGPFYTVEGNHTYAAAGDYTFTVTITDTADGLSTTVTATAHIAQAPLLAVGVPVVVTSGLSVNGAIVAAFADGSGGDSASNYSATIDWGDGTSTPADSITGSGNSFVITGSHTYAAPGGYALKISIADQDGSAGNALAHAFIDSPIASYVLNAFQDILHRAADDAGLSFWTQQINSGMSAAQFASDLTHSAEYFATNVIGPAYQKYLGRSADAAGLAYWTGQMQQGLTDQQLQADFIASPEFFANAGGSNADWISALYNSVLGRAASGSDLSFWENQLAGGTGRSTVAVDFATSLEHAAEAVQNDYFTYLGRTANAAEVNYWVAQFEDGASNENVVGGFVGSPEFVKLHS